MAQHKGNKGLHTLPAGGRRAATLRRTLDSNDVVSSCGGVVCRDARRGWPAMPATVFFPKPMIHRLLRTVPEAVRTSELAPLRAAPPRVALSMALIVLIALIALITAPAAHAQYGGEPPPAAHNQGSHHLFQQNPSDGRAEAPDVPQRDGHMSAADRKLLRQHIEDAARDMYKRQP